jgi:hypothetical protein
LSKFLLYISFAFAYLLLGNGELLAQKTKVSGKVTDKTTGEPLPFVNISFKGTKTGTTTDLDGNYKLESYYASDTLVASFVGYMRKEAKVLKDKEQKIDFQLESTSKELPDLVIKATNENPAHIIFKRVVANKPINNREKLDSYQYEVYNKIEFDINNMSDEFMNSKVFQKFNFIFDNIDSTADEKPFLPVFITESVSDFYYVKKPKNSKEFIKGTRVSGINNESIAQFTGDMYQQINIYENHVSVFGKNFVSPISDNGIAFYKYYLVDSMFVEDYWCYQIDFIPKRKGDLCFDGTMWVNDTTYALKRIEGNISGDANINWVKDMFFKQEFAQVVNEVWMPVKDHLVIDFNIADKKMGFYGRKTTSFRNFVINEPKDESFFAGVKTIVVNEGATEHDDSFWEQNRHEELTHAQQGIYDMIDTLGNLPIVKTYIDVIQTIVTGYKVLGKVELGPYFSVYSFNVVEGHRFQFGGRTSNDFSKKIELSGYGAYGLWDKQFKYGLGTRFFITKQPRRLVQIYYKNDVEQIGISQNAFRSENILGSYVRRNPNNKLSFTEEIRASYFREWFQGLSSQILFRNISYTPLGIIPFAKTFENQGYIFNFPHVVSSEVSLHVRYAAKEEFLSGEFNRISLGTKKPVLEAQYTYGLKGVFGAQYEFSKLVLGLKHKLPLGYLGTTWYSVEAGKIWGTLPFPLLEIHPGNETYGYNISAFNMMNILEFVSDEYVSFNVRHHFMGLFFNRVPLLQKLKWREVFSIKGIYGRLDEKHLSVMDLPGFTSTLAAKPYFEMAAGIENIFKVFRVDVLWRMSYLDNKYDGINVSPIGIRGRLQIDF